MAGAGATIQSLGRTLPDNGHLSDTLVVKDGSTVHNLISIPKFDRLGYTTVFTGGKGTVYDCEGNIIVSAELSSNNLYEFDIRDLYRSGEEQAYLSSFEPPTTLEVLHDRLAHRNKRSIRHAIRKNFIHLPKELAKSTKESSNASTMPAVGRNQPSTRSTGVKIENWPPKFLTILQKLVIQRAALRTCLTEMKMLTLTVTAVILIVMITLTTTYMYTLIFLLLVLHFLV